MDGKESKPEFTNLFVKHSQNQVDFVVNKQKNQ